MFGYTPFMLACELGATDIISLLLNAGCDTNATDQRGRRGLVIAAHAGHGDRVNACLQELDATLERLSSMLAEYEHDPNIKDEFRCVSSSRGGRRL